MPCKWGAGEPLAVQRTPQHGATLSILEAEAQDGFEPLLLTMALGPQPSIQGYV